MPKQTRQLVRHTFKGGRFEDHGLDLDVLSELVAYKNLLVETAKQLWRRNHPERERLPANYEDSFVLKFFSVEGDSTCIPICREVEQPEQGTLFETTDELDGAVNLVADAIIASGEDHPIPEEFPANVLPLFEQYGKTLREDEYIEQSIDGRQALAKYTTAARGRLIELAERTYEDSIDIKATVTMARVSLPRMTLTLDDGRDVNATFRPEDEAIVTSALKDHTSVKVRVQGRGLFSSNGVLQKVAETSHITLSHGGDYPLVEGAVPIWDAFDQIMRDVPDRELDALPADAAAHHDHYIHGTPKQQE